MENRTTWTYLGYYSFIYVLLLLLVLMGYPAITRHEEPILSLLYSWDGVHLPIEVIMVVSGTYWGLIGVFALVSRSLRGG